MRRGATARAPVRCVPPSAPMSARAASVATAALDFLLLETTREYMDKGEAGARALDGIGYRIGARLAERHTNGRPRFTDATEVVLCLCKEFWPLVHGKRIDSLKTNNKGVFVLTDLRLRWIANVCAVSGDGNDAGDDAASRVTRTHTRVCVGMLCGFLTACGFKAEVSADTKNAPQVVFTIRMHGAS